MAGREGNERPFREPVAWGVEVSNGCKLFVPGAEEK